MEFSVSSFTTLKRPTRPPLRQRSQRVSPCFSTGSLILTVDPDELVRMGLVEMQGRATADSLKHLALARLNHRGQVSRTFRGALCVPGLYLIMIASLYCSFCRMRVVWSPAELPEGDSTRSVPLVRAPASTEPGSS